MNSRFSGIFVILILACLLFTQRHFERSQYLEERSLQKTGSQNLLDEVAAERGVDFKHLSPLVPEQLKDVEPIFTALSASTSVFDYNSDGHMDFLALNSRRGQDSKLYVNNGKGKFIDSTKLAGLDKIGEKFAPTKALFFDYDNDGDQDLYLNTVYCDQFYENRDGKFINRTEEVGIKFCGYGMTSNAWDYDRDGDLDLIAAGYFRSFNLYNPESTKLMPNNFHLSTNGGRVVVFENLGNGRFKTHKNALGLHANRFHFAISIGDFRNTGKQDVWDAIDFNQDHVYLENRPGSYTNVSHLLRFSLSRHSMNAEIEDIDHDQIPNIFITQASIPKWSLVGNQMWKWNEKEFKFDNHAKAKGVAHCGWAWGAKFIDLENIGEYDLLVANGFVSKGTEENNDQFQNDYWYHRATISLVYEDNIVDARHWFPMQGFSQSGFQASCYYKRENDQYTHVLKAGQFSRDTYDGRGVAMIDLDNKGKNSVIVTNLLGPLQIFENKTENNNNWIGLNLVGTKSNRDGIGTKVILNLIDSEGNTKIMSKQKYPANGFITQHDPRIHFGIGDQYKVKSIELKWINGTYQKLEDLALNQYHEIVEAQ